MKWKLKFAGWLMGLGMGAALAVPCFAQGPRANWAQNRQDNRPPKQEKQKHIRNDVLPKWQQLPPDRKRAIQQRLGVLKNMPESARNQHLSDPNFTRGMTDEDKSMLRDLSHLHVGGTPEPPNE